MLKRMATCLMMLFVACTWCQVARCATETRYERAALDANMADCQTLSCHFQIRGMVARIRGTVDIEDLTGRQRLCRCAELAEEIRRNFDNMPLSIVWRLLQIERRAIRRR